jgi:hypothetical protein
LLLERWESVLARIADAAYPELTDPSPIVSAFVAALQGQPDLLRLDANGPVVLEKQADLGAVLAFKTALAGRIVETAEVVEQALGLRKKASAC